MSEPTNTNGTSESQQKPGLNGTPQHQFQALQRGLEQLVREVGADSLEGDGEQTVVKVRNGSFFYVLTRVPDDLDGTLTKRESEIAELVAEGLGNKEVADRLGIRTRTVAAHLRYMFKKLGVHNRTELARRVRVVV